MDIDTIYPSDSRSIEISDFFCNYRQYFDDISVFYRYSGHFPKFYRYISQLHKMELLLGGSNPAQNCRVQIFNILSLLFMNVFFNKFMNVFLINL